MSISAAETVEVFLPAAGARHHRPGAADGSHGVGVAAAHLGFGGEDEGGIYHSVYDDFNWFTHFADTDFSYGRALQDAALSAWAGKPGNVPAAQKEFQKWARLNGLARNGAFKAGMEQQAA